MLSIRSASHALKPQSVSAALRPLLAASQFAAPHPANAQQIRSSSYGNSSMFAGGGPQGYRRERLPTNTIIR